MKSLLILRFLINRFLEGSKGKTIERRLISSGIMSYQQFFFKVSKEKQLNIVLINRFLWSLKGEAIERSWISIETYLINIFL